MSFFIEVHCKTAEELIDKFSPRNELWMNKNHPEFSIDPTWIYRGQANANWPLIPPAWRKTLKGNSLFERQYQKYKSAYIREIDLLLSQKDSMFSGSVDVYFPPNSKNKLINLLISNYTEYAGVYDFVTLANRLGLHIPSFSQLHETGKGFFPNYLNTLKNRKSASFWELDTFALAQHHGIPTRLLDWTHNAKKAAYFAAISHKGKSKLAIFALYVPLLAFDGHVIQVVHAASHENDFLRSQEALFTHDIKADEFFISEGRFPTLEETLKSHKYGEKWSGNLAYKFTLPASENIKLLILLRVENIHLASLMPTYDKVAEQVEFDWLMSS